METTESIRFLVQGSASELYEVTFIRMGKELTAFCTCQDGQNRLHCKHRVSILKGSQKNIVSDNVSDVAKVQSWLPGLSIQQTLQHVKICEVRVKAANWEFSDAKRKLAEVMNDTIKYDHDTDVIIIKE